MTATFVTNDTATTDSDSWTVNATVTCDVGCTLTQAYWKTHSQEGFAPYDDARLNIGLLQEDTPFFSSGKTCYEILRSAPKKGDAYLILAHQYIAAQLNDLNGVTMSPSARRRSTRPPRTSAADRLQESAHLVGSHPPRVQQRPRRNGSLLWVTGRS